MHFLLKVLLLVGGTLSFVHFPSTNNFHHKRSDRELPYSHEFSDVKHIRHKRLVGGQRLGSHSWPWIAIVRMHSNLASSLCAGTLLNTRWILTAASCVHHAEHNPEWVTVKLGENFIRSHPKETFIGMMGSIFRKKSWKRYVIKAEKIIIYGKYKRNPRVFDMALIRLSSSVPVTPDLAKRIHPVLLPGKQMVRNWPPDGTGCFILGWGCTKEGSWVESDSPQEMHLLKLPPTSCGVVSPKIAEYKICAGNSTRGSALCFGDTGGPMMCRSDDRWVQAGVVSMKPDENYRMAPFTLVRITRYMPWIRHTIRTN